MVVDTRLTLTVSSASLRYRAQICKPARPNFRESDRQLLLFTYAVTLVERNFSVQQGTAKGGFENIKQWFFPLRQSSGKGARCAR